VPGSSRAGQLLTLVGAAIALAGGFVLWYDATAVYGGRTFELIQSNGWQQPNPALSVLAIGLCVVAGIVALTELLLPSGRGDGAPAVALVPIGFGITAFALVVAKYMWEDAYASMGFVVTGTGAALVALGGVLTLWSRVVARG
jgi:hypothetical protein